MDADTGGFALTVFSSVTAHDDGCTNHSSHGHKPHEHRGDCGGLLIVSIILGLLLLGSPLMFISLD